MDLFLDVLLALVLVLAVTVAVLNGLAALEQRRYYRTKRAQVELTPESTTINISTPNL